MRIDKQTDLSPGLVQSGQLSLRAIKAFPYICKGFEPVAKYLAHIYYHVCYDIAG